MQYRPDWMIRQRPSERAVDALIDGYFDRRTDRVVGPKLFDNPDIPSSYWSARVRAYMVFQPVCPFSSTVMPMTLP